MNWLVWGSLLPSMLLAWAAGFVVRRYARQWGLVDRPGDRKIHSTPTPLGGGIAIWIGVLVPLLMLLAATAWLGDDARRAATEAAWGDSSLWKFVAPHLDGLVAQSRKLKLLLAAATVLGLLGLLDDRRHLDWRLRLAVQTVVAAFMVWQGWRITVFVDEPWVTGPLSVLWIVGLVNTFNMLDNMDGLSAGVAAIAATMLAAVILTAPEPITQGPQLFVGGVLLVLVGALLGFLFHNRPPARLFMGDAGSYFVGFCLATMTMSATFAGEGLPRHAILAPLCVLAVPLYDTITVVWIRLREGRSPFEADKNHISHRLVDLGLSTRHAVLVIYAATLVCGLGAFMLHRVQTLGAILVLLLIAGVLTAVAYVELRARSADQKVAAKCAPKKAE